MSIAPPCRVRVLVLPSSLLLALLAGGCRSAPHAVGSDLPVVPASSRALPGSVNSADAPEAPRVQTNRHEVTTFRDPESGLSFQYPSDWRPLSLAGPMDPPMFTKLFGAAKGTQAFLPEAGTAFSDTDLIGVSFAWTVKRDTANGGCSRTGPALGKPLPPEAIGGLPFTRVSGSDGEGCRRRLGVIDSVSHDGSCYVFERDVQTGCPGVTNSGKGIALSPAQQTELQGQLDQVMASVRLK